MLALVKMLLPNIFADVYLIVKALANADLKVRFVSLKIDPIGNTPEQFAIALKRIYTAANTEQKMIGLVNQ